MLALNVVCLLSLSVQNIPSGDFYPNPERADTDKYMGAFT